MHRRKVSAAPLPTVTASGASNSTLRSDVALLADRRLAHPPVHANARLRDALRQWHDPDAYGIVAHGHGFSGYRLMPKGHEDAPVRGAPTTRLPTATNIRLAIGSRRA